MQTTPAPGLSSQHILKLPAAAAAIARTRFAPPQSVPVTTLLPQEALARLENCLADGDIGGIEISGPGDPLASIETTLATLQLISRRSPGLPLSLQTLGFGAAQQATALQAAGLSQLKIQADAIDPRILEKIYSWIRPGKKTLPLPGAARLLINEQERAIPACKRAGLAVHIVTTVYPGINIDHLAAVARTMAALGADSLTLEPFQPSEGADITLPAAEAALMAETEKACSRYLPVQVFQAPQQNTSDQQDAASALPKPCPRRLNVAVASRSGLDVDLHLGQAKQLLIYGPREDGLTCLLGTRPAPAPGGPGRRWQTLAANLSDCFAILAASAGEPPRSELAEAGITVLITEDSIEGIVDVLYGGGKKEKQCRK